MSAAALHHGYDSQHDQMASRWSAWFPTVVLVILSHAAVWLAWTSWQSRQPVTQPLPAVQISLISMPAPQETKSTPQLQRAPAPAKPQPVLAEKPLTPPPSATTNNVTEQPVAAAESTESTQSEAQQEFSQPLYSAAYLNNPPPIYPLAARRRGIEGTVVVRAQIQEDGHCLQANLSKSSGHEMLDKAAVTAVRSWRFVPAKRGAQTITAWVEVPITFRLTQQDKQT
jgi:protein TonB